MTGNDLYFWYLLSNTAFPWRQDTIGTTEDLGIFFGSLWVLCRAAAHLSGPSLGLDKARSSFYYCVMLC